MSTTPTLRWEKFADARNYRVSVTDAGTSELVFDKTIAEASIQLRGLKPGRTYNYDVRALGANNSSLAFVLGQFKVEGVAPTPAPDGAETEGIPPNCLTRGPNTRQYVNHEDNFCLMYPARFSQEPSGSLSLNFIGPALDKSPEPLFAQMWVTVTPARSGSDLNGAVDEALKEFAGMNVEPMTRKPIDIGGEPGIVVEPVPGRLASRAVFVLHKDVLYRLDFWPLQVPIAEADVEELYQVVTTTFSFLDSIP